MAKKEKAAAPDGDEKPAGKSKLKLIIIIVVVVLLAVRATRRWPPLQLRE